MLTLRQMTKPGSSWKKLSRCSVFDASHFVMSLRSCGLCHVMFVYVRLSEGIKDPLSKLQETYKTLVNLQGDSMVTAPDKLFDCS